MHLLHERRLGIDQSLHPEHPMQFSNDGCGLQHMFDGTRAALDGTTIRCVIDDDSTTHELLLAVQNGSLRVLHAGADARTELGGPTATASGPLSAWMDLLVHAAAGHRTRPDDLSVTGNAASFDAVLHALH